LFIKHKKKNKRDNITTIRSDKNGPVNKAIGNIEKAIAIKFKILEF
jgi:hypothetical protein